MDRTAQAKQLLIERENRRKQQAKRREANIVKRKKTAETRKAKHAQRVVARMLPMNLGSGKKFDQMFKLGSKRSFSKNEIKKVKTMVDDYFKKHDRIFIKYRLDGGNRIIKTIKADNKQAIGVLLATMLNGYTEHYPTQEYSDAFNPLEISEVVEFEAFTPNEWSKEVELSDIQAEIDDVRALLKVAGTPRLVKVLTAQLKELESKMRVARSGMFFPWVVPKELYDDSLKELQIYSDGTEKRDTTHCFLFSLIKLGLIDFSGAVELITQCRGFYSDSGKFKISDIKKLLSQDIPELHIVCVGGGARPYVKRCVGYRLGESRRFDVDIKSLDWSKTLCLFSGHYFAPGNMETIDKVINLHKSGTLIPKSDGYRECKEHLKEIQEVVDESGVIAQLKSKEASKGKCESSAVDDLNIFEAPESKHPLQDPLVFACDTETYPVDDDEGFPVHRAFMITLWSTTINDTEKILGKQVRKLYIGDNVVEECVEDLKAMCARTSREIQVWFFNVKFDLSVFLQRQKFCDAIIRGNTVYSAKIGHEVPWFEVKEEDKDDMMLIKTCRNKTLRRMASEEFMAFKKKFRWTKRTTLFIEFRDLAKIHSGSLDSVAASLGVVGKQQGINYAWHNPENIRDRKKTCNIEDYLPQLLDDAAKAKWLDKFGAVRSRHPLLCDILKRREYLVRIYDMQNAEREKQRKTLMESGFYSDGVLRASEMYEHYCMEDGRVLAECMMKTNDAMLELSDGEIGLDDVRTAAGFAYGIVSPTLTNVHFPVGSMRQYISKFIAGGRVAANQVYARKVLHLPIKILDINSLYPSAIIRILKDFGGFPAGMMKLLSVDDFTDIWGSDKYFLGRFKILKVGRRLDLPFIRSVQGDKIVYTNDPPADEVFFIDRVTLEDWVEWHEVEFEFLGGVYYESMNSSPEFCKIIKKYFDAKSKYKREGKQALCSMVKLIINSAYGKMGQKSIFESTKLKDVDTLRRMLARGDEFNSIEYVSEEQVLVTKSEDSDSTRMPNIVAVLTLSMSRRIMNEIMGIAQVNGYVVYYTDTDSIHVRAEDVEPIRELCRVKYGREVIGNDESQMHNDFSIEHDVDAVGVKAIYCGPKCYFIDAEGKNRDGKVIKDQCVTKLKGVTKDGLIAGEMMERGKTRGERYLRMYKKFCNGGVEMVLNPVGFKKVMMDYRGIGRVYNRTPGSFMRRISFG